jgi:hypothetical protein
MGEGPWIVDLARGRSSEDAPHSLYHALLIFGAVRAARADCNAPRSPNARVIPAASGYRTRPMAAFAHGKHARGICVMVSCPCATVTRVRAVQARCGSRLALVLALGLAFPHTGGPAGGREDAAQRLEVAFADHVAAGKSDDGRCVSEADRALALHEDQEPAFRVACPLSAVRALHVAPEECSARRVPTQSRSTIPHPTQATRIKRSREQRRAE